MDLQQKKKEIMDKYDSDTSIIELQISELLEQKDMLTRECNRDIQELMNTCVHANNTSRFVKTDKGHIQHRTCCDCGYDETIQLYV